MKPTRFVLMCLAMTACGAEPAAFRPTAAVGAAGRGGEPAASYEVRDDNGLLANVTVWSEGAVRAEDDSATLVHVVLGVHNLAGVALTVDGPALDLAVFDGGGTPLGPARLVSAQPAGPQPLVVAAQAAQDGDFWFALPSSIMPTDIGSLRLRWALLQPDGRRYLQFTSFTRDAPRSVGPVWVWSPVYGFYDPFFIGPRVEMRVHHVPMRRIFVPRRHHHR